jgi:HemY protein
MIRAFVLFSILVLLSLGVAWFADHPGRVTVFWLGYRIDASFGALAAALVLVAAVSGFFWRGWGTVANAVRRTGTARAERRRNRGYRALTRGFVAVAAGDAEEARRQSERADALLAEPPLTMLLSAQAAQLGGDEDAAKKYFTAMLDRPDTAFLGLRGLINQALRGRDREQALALARRAYRIRPKTPWLAAMLAELQSRAGEWGEAAIVLHRARKSGTISDGKRAEAVALIGQSDAAGSEGREAEAVELLRRAHKLAPDLVPGAAKLALRLAARGEARRARKIIESAWAGEPHPDLARAFTALGRDEDALARLQRTARLARLRPDSGESHIAIAEAALDASLWGEARRHLRLALLAPNPGRRVFRLMARLEEEEHADAVAARQWLSRAAEAEPDPAWVCRRCAAPAPEWRPLCPSCEAFDGLSWSSPVRPAIAAASGAEVPAPLAPPAGHA